MTKSSKKIAFTTFILIISAGWIFYFLSGKNVNKKKLYIFTYPSFISPYGPGPELKKKFEKNCQCEVIFQASGESGVLIKRMKMDRNLKVDVILGIDSMDLNKTIQGAGAIKLEKPEKNFREEILPYINEKAWPFDWSPLTLVYRVESRLPKNSLSEFLESSIEMSMPDPRTSTVGQQFLVWILSQYPNNPQAGMVKAKKRLKFQAPGWSESYGFFQRKQANVTFSYLTSPLYHWIEEADHSVNPMVFKHPHPLQVEMALIPERVLSVSLAEKFLKFLLTPEAQKILMTKNYMRPVIKEIEKGSQFEKLPAVPVLDNSVYKKFTQKKQKWLNMWEEADR